MYPLRQGTTMQNSPCLQGCAIILIQSQAAKLRLCRRSDTSPAIDEALVLPFGLGKGHVQCRAQQGTVQHTHASAPQKPYEPPESNAYAILLALPLHPRPSATMTLPSGIRLNSAQTLSLCDHVLSYTDDTS